MSLGRRDFIIGTVGTAASAALLDGCGDDGDSKPNGQPDAGSVTPDALPLNTTIFAHGVASGDPLKDRVIIWTRISGALESQMLEWYVATDPELRDIKFGTQVGAFAESDWTVKVDVSGLEPGTTYYYAFTVPGVGRSPIGRTRTLPNESEHARIVFTSCANYQNGYFNAYGAIARRADLDLWVHLGDYIYEYANGGYADANLLGPRALVPPTECLRLADYRARYAHYRADPDLQEIHRQHPLIVVWDDHEFANNAWMGGAENHAIDGSEGSWDERKRAASRAFLEWLPIRVPLVEAEPVAKIFRSFQFGELFDLIMLDTRLIARAKQAGGDLGLPGSDVGDPAVAMDESRQLLGSEQEQWFLDALSKSRDRGAIWRLIGNQVIFAQTRSPITKGILYSDFWDGYQPARRRVIQHLLTGGIRNVVFMTGDIHSSWAMEISEDPFALEPKLPFAIELVGPSITSLAFEETAGQEGLVSALLNENKHVKFGEATRKGYVLLDVTRTRLQAEWYVVDQFKMPGVYSESVLRAYSCEKDTARLVEATMPTSPKESRTPPA